MDGDLYSYHDHGYAYTGAKKKFNLQLAVAGNIKFMSHAPMAITTDACL